MAVMMMTTAPEELERMRVRRQQDEASALGNARRQNSIEIAKTMRAEGMDVDTVARITKLTVDDILRL